MWCDQADQSKVDSESAFAVSYPVWAAPYRGRVPVPFPCAVWPPPYHIYSFSPSCGPGPERRGLTALSTVSNIDKSWFSKLPTIVIKLRE